MKKTLITVLSVICMAFACVGVGLLNRDKTTKKPVIAETIAQDATYETPVSYGLMDLFADNYGMGIDLTSAEKEALLSESGRSYTALAEYGLIGSLNMSSATQSFSLKFDFKTNLTQSGALLVYFGGMGLEFYPYPSSWCNDKSMNGKINLVNMGTNPQPECKATWSNFTTIEIIKANNTDESGAFLLTIKVNDVTYYSAERTCTAEADKLSAELKVQGYKPQDCAFRSSNYSDALNLETATMVDVADIDTQLLTKTTISAKDQFFFSVGTSTLAKYGTESVGVTMRVTADRSAWSTTVAWRFRFGNNFMIYFKGSTFESYYCAPTTGTWGPGTNASYSSSASDGAENEYQIIRQKNNGSMGGYLFTVKENGNVVQKLWVKYQPKIADDDAIHTYVNTTGFAVTMRSATHYGVTETIDGVSTTTKVAKGTAHTLNYAGEKLCFGWLNGENLLANGSTVSDETQVTALVLGASNDEGVSLRWIHEGSASLKWTARFDKSDLDAVIAYFGAENVSLGYEISTANDTSKTIKKIGVDTKTEGDEVIFSVLLSKVKESHYDWVYSTRTFIVIDGVEYSVADNDNAKSLSQVAQSEYDLNSESYTAAQLAVLQTYFN